jgi:hypothetical protein
MWCAGYQYARGACVTMVEHFVERFAFMLGFTALTLCVGLLLLMAAREVYEVDPRRKEMQDPLGLSRSTWEWVLMSDFAQNARTELKLLARHFAVALRVLVYGVVALYAIDLTLQFLVFVAKTGWLWVWLGQLIVWVQQVWKDLSDVEYLARYGLSIVVVCVAPLFIARTAAIVRHVVRAKDEPMTNKDPWWV